MQIREVATGAPVGPLKPGGNPPPQPGEAAKRNRTQQIIKSAQASTLGQKPKIQIQKLKDAAKKLATDPNADDEAMDNIDTVIKGIQSKSGINA